MPPVKQDLSGDTSVRNPFRFSPPQSDSKLFETGNLSSPLIQLVSSGRQSHVITPISTERLSSDTKVRTNRKSPKSPIISPLSPLLTRLSFSADYDDLQFMQTPVRSLFHENDEDDEDDPASRLKTTEKKAAIAKTPKPKTHVGTPMPVSSRAKLQRSVSRITSYKEPSLTVKVRKGFKFFAFDNDA